MSIKKKNRSTPPGVLAALSSDADVNVRRAVARRPSAPMEVLARLAADPDAAVRRAVAGRHPM